MTTLRSLYSPVNSEDVVQNLIKEHQRNIQLLLIEDLQTGLHVVSQFLLFHWDVILHTQKHKLSKILTRAINDEVNSYSSLVT